MVEQIKKPTPYEEITLHSQKAERNVNGEMRWFEDKQEIQFENPQFKGANAEFSIVNRPFQKIWFSQLSSRGITEDFNSPLLDEIILKDQYRGNICEKFKTAAEFWNAVKGKKFIITIKGKGFYLNKESNIVSILNTTAVTGAKIPKKTAEENIFEYIRQCVIQGKLDNVRGTLKNKTAYLLTEI
ncbi:MAG: hypothetical protein HDS52_10755 [Barnesiella sp.]|nr:hypothetical protein [Barnesiella sp.]